ncbi:N-acetylmannosamine-6-phosphate 2-epimerase [Ereboglobus luteus]|uniref:Putative N-acetylmannosamine-6-phosphate 2-epimerase n=1 Tax=Ereboglobus luteus TaxID=1796921 RepID=A0A2U8E401_9BACT|nr:N-acetylmannosamine-6-phosphate 2-epimerase [Ereboglobus luteus]AWI09252.1 N-acetylmannosamine-6-phosphate 2-epimerase [Ereboglobus luteus]
MNNKLFDSLRGKLVVSCQAEEGSPFNTPEGVSAFAQSAVRGGAAGIRTCGIEKTACIVKNVTVPVIGLTKAYFPDGTVCITGAFEDVEQLVKAGASIVAVDGTSRARAGGLGGADYIRAIKQRHNIIIMADIATPEEALACHEAGADCVSTTLCGYTPDTLAFARGNRPAFDMLDKCLQVLPRDYPVFAEGRFNTPTDAQKAVELGAWAVVVGSAITRPHLITQWFVDAINEKGKDDGK